MAKIKIEVEESDLILLGIAYGDMIRAGLNIIINVINNDRYPGENVNLTDGEKIEKVAKIIKKLSAMEETKKDLLALEQVSDAIKTGTFTKNDFFIT